MNDELVKAFTDLAALSREWSDLHLSREQMMLLAASTWNEAAKPGRPTDELIRLGIEWAAQQNSLRLRDVELRARAGRLLSEVLNR